jgi:hypothetical protein
MYEGQWVVKCEATQSARDLQRFGKAPSSGKRILEEKTNNMH